ncbi:hypothetical protein HS125_19235 [bacterium]|nr:hypothetical protein [bacterium]
MTNLTTPRNLPRRLARWTALGVLYLLVAWALLEVFLRLVPQVLPRQAFVRLPGLGMYLYQGRAWCTEPDDEAEFRFVPGATLTVPGGARHGDLYALGQCTPTAEELLHLDRVPDATFTADGLGFRGRYGEGRPRILFLGDSFVLSKNFPLNEAWTGRVADQLQVETINVGLYAYGPPHEYAALARSATEYAPDLVLHVLFDGNDLADAQRWVEWKASGLPFWRWQVRDKSPWETSPVRALLAWMLDALKEPEINPLQPFRGAMHGRTVVLAFSPPYLRELAWSPEAVRAEPGWPPMLEAIRASRELCRRRGIDYRLVLAPSKETVYAPEVLNKVMAHEAGAAAGLPADADPMLFVPEALRHQNGFAAAVREWAEAEGIPCLDLLPAFRRALHEGRPQSYFAFDSHWNAVGHEIAAGAVVDYLRPSLSASTGGSP